MTQTITLPFKQRAVQVLLSEQLKKYQYFVAVCHRGAGKSIQAITTLIKWAVEEQGLYAYICPSLKQVKRNNWESVKNFLKDIPAIKFNETELTAVFPNGSKIFLEGAEEPDRIRGVHLKGAVLDEVADMPANTWMAVIFPALQIHNGKCLFIGTPKGDNEFKDFYLRGQDSEFDNWGSIIIDIYASGVFDEKKIEQIKREMNVSLFSQEMLCSFDAKFDGAYYGRTLIELEQRGALEPFGIDMNKPVYTGWDLGLSDKTCIWFAQLDFKNETVYLIDYIEDKDKLLAYYIEQVKRKPYVYAKHYIPHDSQQRDINTGHHRVDTFRAHGLKTEILPKTSNVNADIAAVQSLLYKCKFDRINTKEGITHLKSYSAGYDRMSGEYRTTPKHDSHSDAADAFRYLILGTSKEFKEYKGREMASRGQRNLTHRIDPLENVANLRKPAVNRYDTWQVQ